MLYKEIRFQGLGAKIKTNCLSWVGLGEEPPCANRLEKSVSVRRKRAPWSLFSQEIRFLEDCLSLKALTRRLFSSRLLVLCKKPKVQEARVRETGKYPATKGQPPDQAT